MIEVWCKRAWINLAGPLQKLKARSLGLVKRVSSKPMGIALTVATPLLMLSWHLIALTNRPLHLDQIVAELGSTTTKLFYYDPMPDHDETRLVYIESTENGYGIFWSTIADGQKKAPIRRNL